MKNPGSCLSKEPRARAVGLGSVPFPRKAERDGPCGMGLLLDLPNLALDERNDPNAPSAPRSVSTSRRGAASRAEIPRWEFLGWLFREEAPSFRKVMGKTRNETKGEGQIWDQTEELHWWQGGLFGKCIFPGKKKAGIFHFGTVLSHSSPHFSCCLNSSLKI